MASVTDDRVRVVLHVYVSPEVIEREALQDGNYFLAVTGPGRLLGNLDPAMAPRMATTGNDIWTKELWLLKNSIQTYNYLVVHRTTNKTLHRETIDVREVRVHVLPLTTGDTYDQCNSVHNARTEQSSRPNISRITPRPQNKVNATHDGQKVQGDCLDNQQNQARMPADSDNNGEEVKSSEELSVEEGVERSSNIVIENNGKCEV